MSPEPKCYAMCAGFTACGKGDPDDTWASADLSAVTCAACLKAESEWIPLTEAESRKYLPHLWAKPEPSK